jgi:outer membrane protein assembly factor BamD (BamD/ComL family)
VSQNRIVRPHVSHDHDLQDAAAHAVDFFQEHGRNLAIGGGVLVALIVGIALFQANQASSEKAASVQLAQATRDLENNALEPAAAKLGEIVQRHGGSKAGLRARFFLGTVELKRGNNAAAEAQFRAFLGKVGASDYFRAGGQRGLAVALENQSKYAEAAAAYEAIPKGNVGEDEKAHALVAAARARTLAGDKAGALALYDRVIKEFPTSRSITPARLHKAELQGAGG